MSAVTRSRALHALLGLLSALGSTACGGRETSAVQGAPASLVHLADQLDRAVVESAAAPDSARATENWSFDEPRPEWRVVSTDDVEWLAAPVLEQQSDCLRFTLAKADAAGRQALAAGLAIDLDDSPLASWDGVLVRARSHERIGGMALAYNVEARAASPRPFVFMGGDEGTAPVFNDGSVQTYFLPAAAAARRRDAGEPGGLRRGAAGRRASRSSRSRSCRAAPTSWRTTACARSRATRSRAARSSRTRRRALAWRVRVPEGGRLDVGLACLPGESVDLPRDGRRPAREARVLLEETRRRRREPGSSARSTSSRWAGQEIELALEAESDAPGAVALWGAPIVSGAPAAPRERPNVIFYVIDGGGADLMSVYGYNRRTTPFLERLAAEGVGLRARVLELDLDAALDRLVHDLAAAQRARRAAARRPLDAGARGGRRRWPSTCAAAATRRPSSPQPELRRA